MKLNELIKNVGNCKVKGDANVEVSHIAYNTLSVLKDSCFVAIRGNKFDGRLFVRDAIAKGANAIVTEEEMSLPTGVTNIVVSDSRLALASISSMFFGEPSKKMSVIGVTGTNGKTTITYILEEIFRAASRNPAVIGTVSYRYGGKIIPALHTTPMSFDLQRLFSKMNECNVDICAMEVSSHALSQHRVSACHFDAAVFTNLTQEHLDFHGEMDSYFMSKAALFEDLLAKSEKKNVFAVINVDDSYGLKLVKRCPTKMVLYGFDPKADVRATKVSFDASGIRMKVETPVGAIECKTRLCGRFNAQNILAAISVAINQGVDFETISRALENTTGAPGRFELIENNRGVLAVVDYAHTPDALKNVLSNARELANGGRLIVVFGCGGDRDRSKRPVMGRVACELADISIVTSDNPRTENPMEIISEIVSGLSGLNIDYKIIEDRYQAISYAASSAKAGDVLVVAGKGHEDYQIVGDRKIHFDDREILREIFVS